MCGHFMCLQECFPRSDLEKPNCLSSSLGQFILSPSVSKINCFHWYSSIHYYIFLIFQSDEHSYFCLIFIVKEAVLLRLYVGDIPEMLFFHNASIPKILYFISSPLYFPYNLNFRSFHSNLCFLKILIWGTCK